MKNIFLLTLSILVLLVSCQNQNGDQKGDSVEFQRDFPDLSGKKLTPEILWSLGRVGSPQVSPDNQLILYAVSYYSINQNRSNSDIFIMRLDRRQPIALTETSAIEHSPVWRPDGKKIGFISNEGGSFQVWEMNPDGSGKRQLTNEQESISGFKYAPDMEHILLVKSVELDALTTNPHDDLPKSNLKIYDDLMVRHWDSWTDNAVSHVFVATYNLRNGSVGKPDDIMADEPFDAPIQPFGGMEEINWSSDGKQIAYTSKKKQGLDYALSTNSEIYLYDLETKETENLSAGMQGYDKAPIFSPDGKKIAWLSMERDGFEADKNRIIVYDFETKKTTNFSEDFDQSAASLAWSKNGEELFFISGINATYQLYKLNLAENLIRNLTTGIHNYTGFSLAQKFIVAAKQSMSVPTELYLVNIEDGSDEQLTFVNTETWEQLNLAQVESYNIRTTDNQDMLTWVILPPNFDPNKKYPTLLYCQGGPQSAVSQFFSYRWNFQLMAANGYIIVAPNRRGLPTFGQEWNDQISGDYGGQNMRDYFSAIDSLSQASFVDSERLGAIGASYGGFSIFWLAGNHQKRFKTFIAHAGIFNFESMYGSTEELFFVDWDLGGPYWSPRKRNSYDASPHLFVKNWDTPILIFQGGKDYRIPYTQALSAFTAAQMQGVDSKLVFFPDENHWILSPQNGIAWQREFYSWLDNYLK